MVVEQGYLPLPLEDLAKRIGISKALIYRYYPTQVDLFDALLELLFQDLDLENLSRLSETGEVEMATIACAETYFDHVCQYGPALYILSSDLYFLARLDPVRLRDRARLMAKLARRLRVRFGLNARDSLAALRMFAAIAEEGGAMTFRDPNRRAIARRTLSELIQGAMKGLSQFQSDSGVG